MTRAKVISFAFILILIAGCNRQEFKSLSDNPSQSIIESHLKVGGRYLKNAETWQWSGSGVVIGKSKKRSYILTAKHVLAHLKEVKHLLPSPVIWPSKKSSHMIFRIEKEFSDELDISIISTRLLPN
jgi:S1-C subfamily serine protease